MDNKLLIKILKGEDARNFVDPFYKTNNKPHTARDTDIFFCAFINNQIIGTVRFCIEENTPLLRSMLIHEDYRFKGIGHELLKEFQSYLFANNIQDTFCIPYAHLINFYGLIGFKEIKPDEAPTFLYKRFLSYSENYPDNSYSMMIRKS